MFLRPVPDPQQPVHIMFAMVDHYEPDWNNADDELQIRRVQRWVDDYPQLVSHHQDADGCPPKYTFFYPIEVYQKQNLALLEQICSKGLGEVEIHLHHDNDTEDDLRQRLQKGMHDLASHGYLGQRALSGKIRYAFIHGNWCINNSRKDGKWCGVNNESKILAETGCYADFTMPSAPSDTQINKVNSIYYSSSSPDRPKSHRRGKNARVGKFFKEDLMYIQGPLALNWKRRKFGLLPRIENSEISGLNHPTNDRVDLWIKQHIHVEGKPNWVFVKVYAHGAPEKNADTLLGEPMNQMFHYLEKQYNDGKKYQLHYVSAREMYNIIKAAESDEKGNPGDYRNYIIEKNVRHEE